MNTANLPRSAQDSELLAEIKALLSSKLKSWHGYQAAGEQIFAILSEEAENIAEKVYLKKRAFAIWQKAGFGDVIQFAKVVTAALLRYPEANEEWIKSIPKKAAEIQGHYERRAFIEAFILGLIECSIFTHEHGRYLRTDEPTDRLAYPRLLLSLLVELFKQDVVFGQLTPQFSGHLANLSKGFAGYFADEIDFYKPFADLDVDNGVLSYRHEAYEEYRDAVLWKGVTQVLTQLCVNRALQGDPANMIHVLAQAGQRIGTPRYAGKEAWIFGDC